MELRDIFPIAIQMAAEAHDGTISKDGTPYILHPIRLMMWAEGYEQQIAAILHDTIEDTYLTLGHLRDAGIPNHIVEAIDCLSKREGEAYEDFIERIALNPLATAVKLLDLRDNIDVTRMPELTDWDLKRTAKYHRAIRQLTNQL